MRKNKAAVFLLSLLFLVFSGSLQSCKVLRLDKASRMEKRTTREFERKQRKEDAVLLKEYDKKYKHQTKIQAEKQRKKITKSRKKPMNMRPKRRFFLWRWLGI